MRGCGLQNAVIVLLARNRCNMQARCLHFYQKPHCVDFISPVTDVCWRLVRSGDMLPAFYQKPHRALDFLSPVFIFHTSGIPSPCYLRKQPSWVRSTEAFACRITIILEPLCGPLYVLADAYADAHALNSINFADWPRGQTWRVLSQREMQWKWNAWLHCPLCTKKNIIKSLGTRI